MNKGEPCPYDARSCEVVVEERDEAEKQVEELHRRLGCTADLSNLHDGFLCAWGLIEGLEDAVEAARVKSMERAGDTLKLREVRAWHMAVTEKDANGECVAEGGECSLCGILDCPYDDPLHYHHDGCPSEYAVEQGLAMSPNDPSGPNPRRPLEHNDAPGPTESVAGGEPKGGDDR